MTQSGILKNCTTPVSLSRSVIHALRSLEGRHTSTGSAPSHTYTSLKFKSNRKIQNKSIHPYVQSTRLASLTGNKTFFDERDPVARTQELEVASRQRGILTAKLSCNRSLQTNKIRYIQNSKECTI
jgi:hypothetical protein